MRQWNLCRTLMGLTAILVMASSLTLLGCSGNDDDDDADTRNVSSDVALDSSTASVIQGQTFNIPNGSVFDPSIGNNPATLTFNTPSTFTLSSGGSQATGDASFGSCIFGVRTSTFAAGRGPQVGARLIINTCSIRVTASNVLVGGSGTSGTVVLVLNTIVSSNSITVTVIIRNDGILIVNTVVTTIDTDTTGTTGSGGS